MTPSENNNTRSDKGNVHDFFREEPSDPNSPFSKYGPLFALSCLLAFLLVIGTTGELLSVSGGLAIPSLTFLCIWALEVVYRRQKRENASTDNTQTPKED